MLYSQIQAADKKSPFKVFRENIAKDPVAGRHNKAPASRVMLNIETYRTLLAELNLKAKRMHAKSQKLHRTVLANLKSLNSHLSESEKVFVDEINLQLRD